MNPFIHFLRFFTLADNGKAVPNNYNQPDSTHADLPVVAGDRLRFLVPRSDLGGLDFSRLAIHLLRHPVDFPPPNDSIINYPPPEPVLPDPIGGLRPQLGEISSVVRLRVNSAPKEGEHRQFALLVDIPNALNSFNNNLALNKPVMVSSAAGPAWASEHLTDGLGGIGWSSDGQLSVQDHVEYVVIDLEESALIESVTLVPTFGQGWPIDFTIDLSDDNSTWTTAITKTGAVQPQAPQTFAMPAKAYGRYVRIRATKLRYINPLDPYYRFQLGEVQIAGKLADEVRTLGGTFSGQKSDLTEYVQAIKAHFQANPYTPVSVIEDGNELEIRFHHSERFRLGHAPVRVGLGAVTESNTNQPTMAARKMETVTIGAKDAYTLVLSDDIEAGNVFTLAGKSYTASGKEQPAAILRALGVPDGKITVPSGTPVGLSVQKGNYTLANTNQPRIELLYTGNNGGGQDIYQAFVGADVQPGNLYQISAPGLTTRSKIATESDTKVSIEAFFNNSGDPGRMAIPQGQVPTAVAIAGTRTYENTNNPSLGLTGKVTTPAKVVDRYAISIGSSIRRGNQYVLGAATVIADQDDTTIDIARKFGHGSNPFTVEIPTGQQLTAYATPGLLYGPEHIADVEVIEGANWTKSGQLVADVVIPEGLKGDRYALALWDWKAKKVIAQSNYLRIRPTEKDTLVIRYGDPEQVYGYEYSEPGLFQQMRLPICLNEGRLQQQENIWDTLDEIRVRDRTTGILQRELITRALPESFHLALWAALKHREVWINGKPFRSEGEYKQSAAVGKRRLMNGVATVVETGKHWTNYAQNKPYLSSYESAGYAFVKSIVPNTTLNCWLQEGNFVQRIYGGQAIEPQVYQLLVQGTSERLAVIVFLNGTASLRAILEPTILNRIDSVLVVEAGSQVIIEARPFTTDFDVNAWFNQLAESDQGAFTNEYTDEFL
ncbi:discoidin domain-containing protein [Tellurirhabdus bombi]|uniref:discoidin domain-containing protein n=1 Tax=Tellurirhabdus bombi TaxID=2907205 RepID=UPI001F2382BF|nr:discoidin domain-containing protein [Tellurirhabdus bombi]